MRPVEAEWIKRQLLAAGPERCSPVANVGSSTLEFRTLRKPHIEQLLLKPLREAGFEFVHIDIKAAPGVDMVGDLTDPHFLAEVQARNCKSVICSNLLEHLPERQGVIDACQSMVRGDGVMIMTVPYSYPYHPDPIDTLYRASPEQLAAEFPELEMTTGIVLRDGTALREAFAKGLLNGLLYVPMALARVARFWRPRIALAQAHQLTWLFRQYAITCAVFRRPAS